MNIIKYIYIPVYSPSFGRTFVNTSIEYKFYFYNFISFIFTNKKTTDIIKNFMKKEKEFI